MASEYDGKIVSLTVQEGNKPGQPIATYLVGRRERYLVFLPAEANGHIGKEVKVKLVDTGRTDSRGMALFRAESAPAEYSSRWRDNGDGTASKITIATSWLNEQDEVGVEETRQMVVSEMPEFASTRTDRVVVWGSDLASSVVLEEHVRIIPTKKETVSVQGSIVRETVSNREERDAAQAIPVTAVTITAGLVLSSWQRVQYQDSDAVSITVSIRADFASHYVIDGTTWGKAPTWIRDQHLVRFPVCSCGRQRRDVQTSDGYAKCELCRKEEKCARCGQQKTIQLIVGKLICSTCKPLEEAEQKITSVLEPKHREKISAVAKKLRAGQALPQETGEMILQATAEHIESEWRRSSAIERWKSYQWYYFTDEGVYGTKFDSSTLQLFEHFPQVSGDVLIEMVAWIGDGPKCPSSNDFYYRRMQGAQVSLSDIAQSTAYTAQKITEGNRTLADRLRGSEADRIAALEGLRRLSETLGKENKEVKQVAEILQADEQHYHKAVELIKQTDYRLNDRQRAIDAGEIWQDVFIDISTRSRVATDVFAIGSDGLIIDPIVEKTDAGRKSRVNGYRYGDLPNSVLVVSHSHDDYGYQDTEVWEVHCLPAKVSEAQTTTLRRVQEETRHYFTGPGTGWDLRQVGTVTFSTAYHRDFQGAEQASDSEMRSNFSIDVTLWEQSVGDDGTIVVGPYRRRSAESKAMKAAEDAELEARGWVMCLGSEKEEAQETHAAVEEEWLGREDIRDGSRPIEEGTVFLVPAFVRENPEGKNDLVYGPFFDWASGTQVKLILDPFAQVSAHVNEQSRDVLVRVRPRSGSQLHLFETFLRPQAGGHKQRTLGYFVIPVLSPEDFDRQIAEAEEQHKAAEAMLEKAKRAADYVAAKKRREQEEVRTVAEVPTTYHSTDPSESLNPLAAALAKALQQK